MRISEIAQLPTVTDGMPERCHESVLRSYHIVEKVRELLEKKVPHDVILELILKCKLAMRR